jgi:hypothetical protein
LQGDEVAEGTAGAAGLNEEYLWNRSGEPDEEVVRLERLLAPLGRHVPLTVRRKSRLPVWLAIAATVIAGVVSVPLIMRGPVTSWKSSSGNKLRAGQWVDAGKIESADTGEVSVEPGSRLRLVAANENEERFDLARGTIHAFIWAPPGRFVVDTPSAKTVDLGCRYTLQVSQNGTGLLTVEMGWVAFESHGAESFIPAGAACVTRPSRGPGTPYFTDAPRSLTAALERFDTTADSGALQEVVANARARDAVTLWHLLTRTRGERRAEVFDRFASLVTLPREVTREAILHGDIRAFDAAWNSLDLGNTDWWRQWKRQW